MAKRYRAQVIGSTADQVSVRIYNQARKGTPYNPGVPVDLANLLVAQAKHETGDFTSNAFKRQNNAFGYAYYAGSNYQKDQGTDIISDNGKPVAEYASIEDSVNEIVDWIYRRSRAGQFPADLSTIKTPAQYAGYLKSAGYFGDTLQNYLNGLVSWFKIITPAAAGSAGVVLLVLAAVLYFYRK
jgi:hypothetical protein